ncbi:arrestin domain-containing protein 3-like [Patiria miniata]|uniref:Arrestin C-terminal-like domain-containing protein n=1 Tax=Patiria miniata TaxID=46514 RepID=A0A914BNC5_PATMI|nr:arrestin domain-containing protein 3-like [Patiria miniata]
MCLFLVVLNKLELYGEFNLHRYFDMGKLQNLQIVLDKNVFGQGDVIKGHIAMEVDPEALKDVKSIRMRFRGFTRICLRRGKYEPRYFQEEYFNTTLCVFDTDQGSTARNPPIQPGTNRIPFEFPLPTDRPLPFSFANELGGVTYLAKAEVSVKQLLLTKDYKTLKHFSMIGPKADLNTMADVGTEFKETTTRHRFLGFGRVQDVTTIGLPRRGYVPGESITVTGHVDNRGGQIQTQFKAKLVQKSSFISPDNRESCHPCRNTLLSTASASVTCPRGQSTDLTVGPLLIPPVPPSGLVGCGLIDTQYFVRVKYFDRSGILPLVIGTVPLRTRSPVPSLPAASDFTDQSAARVEKWSPDGRTPSAPSYDDSHEAPPPSYEEAVGVSHQPTGGQDREDYFRSEDHFVPRYPYFNLSGR